MPFANGSERMMVYTNEPMMATDVAACRAQRRRLILRPGAIVVGGEPIQVALEHHLECDPVHCPGAAGDAPADAVLDAPVPNCPLRLAGERGGLPDGEAFLDG